MTTTTLETAYDVCLSLAHEHYENFPVASILLPKHLRRPVAAIYAFARTADDIADEGERSDQERLQLLDAFQRQLEAIQQGGHAEDPLFIALAHSIEEYDLPYKPFFDLLSAFKQDTIKKRYASFDEIMDYCRRSANPVGYLLLCLFKSNTDENIAHSDAICSSLQLINFLQDIQVDYSKGRIYLPQDELRQHQLGIQAVAASEYNDNLKDFIDKQIDRIEKLMLSGKPLGRILPGRIGLELRATVAGGLAVLNKLRKQNRKGFPGRARLGPLDWVRIVAHMF